MKHQSISKQNTPQNQKNTNFQPPYYSEEDEEKGT
jgi:hypothetical protein